MLSKTNLPIGIRWPFFPTKYLEDLPGTVHQEPCQVNIRPSVSTPSLSQKTYSTSAGESALQQYPAATVCPTDAHIEPMRLGDSFDIPIHYHEPTKLNNHQRGIYTHRAPALGPVGVGMPRRDASALLRGYQRDRSPPYLLDPRQPTPMTKAWPPLRPNAPITQALLGCPSSTYKMTPFAEAGYRENNPVIRITNNTTTTRAFDAPDEYSWTANSDHYLTRPKPMTVANDSTTTTSMFGAYQPITEQKLTSIMDEVLSNRKSSVVNDVHVTPPKEAVGLSNTSITSLPRSDRLKKRVRRKRLLLTYGNWFFL